METVQRFIYPETLAEALEALAAGREEARAIAGGTSLVFRKGRGSKALVDITRLGLDEIRSSGDGLALGACVRLQQLAEAPELAAPALRGLAEAASRAGSRGIRNAVTLGGNLAGYKPWSDTPPALMALGATAHVEGGEPRDVAVSELLIKHPQTLLAPGELITSFFVPTPSASTGSAFVEVGTTAVDYALVNAAARVVLDGDGVCREVSLVLGAVRNLPTDASAQADALVGAEPTGDALDQVAERVAAEIEPGEDLRVSKEYLATLTGTAARDALELAVQRARGEEPHA